MNIPDKIIKSKDFLETWEFSPSEWNSYVKAAKLLKKEDNIYFGVAILIAGIPFLMFVRNTTFLMASIFVIPFAFLIPWARNKFLTSYLKTTNNSSTVHFYSDYILVNDKRINLFGDKRWIKSMKIINTKNSLSLLEIEIAWSTRKGDTFDEVRVPIPTDKMERAEGIIEYYRQYKNGVFI